MSSFGETNIYFSGLLVKFSHY